MKKLLSIALALVLALGLCAPAMAAESIQVAAIETAYGSDIWVKVAEAFTAQTGIAVDLITDKNLEDVIGPAMQGGEFPDVIHLATGRPAGLTEQFIKDNNIADITDVLSMTVPGEEKLVSEKIAGGFTDTSLTNPYNDGKTYLAPMFYSPCGLFYNAGLFEEKGWSVPATWDEMWALGETAKNEGIALFTYPTTGYFDAFFYAMMYAAGGEDFFKKATTYSEGVWDTAEAGKLFETVSKLAPYTEKTTVANANNDNYLKNQQLILDNKALFMPNGTWVVGEMATAPKSEGFKWGFSAMPAFTAGDAQYSYTFFEQVWSPKKAKNPELADKFIAFLYSDEAADIFLNAGKEEEDPKGPAIQPIKGITDKLTGEDKLMYGIYDDGKVKPALGAFATTDPVEGVSMADSLFSTIDSIMNGSKTVDQWKNEVKAASDKLRGALK